MFPERVCSECDDVRKKKWGCRAEYVFVEGAFRWVDEATVPVFINGEEVYQCPARPWLDDPEMLMFLYDAFAHYQNGFLLEEGAIMDQPFKTMKAMAILSDQVLECDKQKREADRQRQEHRQRAQETVANRGRQP